MNKENKILKNIKSIFQMTFIVTAVLLLSSCTPQFKIDNPYESIDWKSDVHYKANFHTHTTGSDGRMNPHTVVDKYHRLGYSVLAITDHNRVTYPWTSFDSMEASRASIERLEKGELEEQDIVYENRDPQQIGMLSIQGNELSKHHHMGSFFNDHNNTTTEEESLKSTAEKDGITILFHPGKYNKSIDWYVNLFKKYNHLIGLEATQQGNRYPNDRMKWDSILTVTMPKTPVWGFSNDDMHLEDQLGTNWNVLILPELTKEWVREGMKEGRFFYVYSSEGHKVETFPSINSIHVDHQKETIKINSTGSDSILWISSGKIIQKGNILKLKNNYNVSKYVRAEVYGSNGVLLGTQPFGIEKKDNRAD